MTRFPSRSRVRPFEFPLGYRKLVMLGPSSDKVRRAILLLGISENKSPWSFHKGPSVNPNPVAICSTAECSRRMSRNLSTLMSNASFMSSPFIIGFLRIPATYLRLGRLLDCQAIAALLIQQIAAEHHLYYGTGSACPMVSTGRPLAPNQLSPARCLVDAGSGLTRG